MPKIIVAEQSNKYFVKFVVRYRMNGYQLGPIESQVFIYGQKHINVPEEATDIDVCIRCRQNDGVWIDYQRNYDNAAAVIAFKVCHDEDENKPKVDDIPFDEIPTVED